MNLKGRMSLHAYVSDWAHDIWHDNAGDLGFSVSALLEALAMPDGEGTPRITAVLDSDGGLARDARRIDAKRRRRAGARRRNGGS
jgi:hypothetical protein